MKKLLTILTIVATLTSVVYVQTVQAAWYDNDWDFRKSHTINSATGAGTNYQIPITINRSSGTDSGQDVYVGTNIESDYSDLRFTSDDEVTELDYWIATSTSASAEVWVEVSADLSSSNQDIYMYYGNNSATGQSSGDNTFLHFDDFNDGTIDTGKWVKEAENGSITEQSGYLRVGGGTSSGSPYGWSSLGSSPGYTGFQDNAVMVRTRNSTDAIAEIAFRGDFANDDGYKMRSDARSGQGYGTLKPPYTVGVWDFVCSADGSSITVDQWYEIEIVVVGTSITAFRDGNYQTGTQIESCSDSEYSAAGEISLQNHFGDHTDYDWVAVRKAVSTEPTNGAWGTEESAPSTGENEPQQAVINNGTIHIDNGRIIVD